MKPFGPLRRLLLAAVLLPTFVFAAPKKFDIPAQPAGAALQLFGKQASADVTYPAPALKDVRSTEVNGEMEPTAALDQLLAGTGFMARQTATTRFVVTKIEAEKPGAIEGSIRDESGKPVAGAKVAITDSDKAVATDKRGRFLITSISAGTYVLQITADGLQNARVTDVTVNAGQELSMSPITIPVRKQGTLELETYTVSAKKNDGVLELDPYAVSGAKQQPFANGNMDIPRTINDAQPYYILDAKTIAQSGATNVEDFLKQRLTMNTVAVTNAQKVVTAGVTTAATNTLGNASQIDLRGLGANKTLILVNGRRIAGLYQPSGIGDPSASQADLNGIPLSAIDRIEVLPSSASGIYGGGALGGVINVVLKNKFTGGELRVNYDNSFQSDSPRRAVSFNYGMGMNEGKTQIRISAQWSDSKPLLLQDRRQFVDRGIKQILQANPNFLNGNGSPFLGSLPNVQNATATVTNVNGVTFFNPAPLTLKTGQALNAGRTFVPAGTSSSTPVATRNAGLLANAGLTNFELPPTIQPSRGLLSELSVTPKTRSLMASLSQNLLPNFTVTVDFAHNENDSSFSALPGNGLSNLVSAANPNNPFTSNVRVIYPTAISTTSANQSTTDSFTIGLLAKLPRNWIGQGDFTWSRNRSQADYALWDTSAYSADVSSGVVNPFTDTLAFPLNLNKYVAKEHYSNENAFSDYTLRASGPFFALPWGAPELTVGIEHLQSVVPANSQTIIYPVTTTDNQTFHYYELSQSTDSGYAEARLPLIKQDWLPLVHSLELQLAGRVDRYKVDNGTPGYFMDSTGTKFYNAPTNNDQPFFSKAKYSASNSTAGIRYEPLAGIILRVSTATAFTPPTPAQLAKNPQPDLFPTDVSDPKNGNQFVSVQTLSGGNPDLRPQNSKSFNAGIIWQPSGFLQGLRLNAEYYRIQQYDAISNLSAQLLVTNESLFPSRVIRNASGAIVTVDTSALNVFKLESEGWDFSANYQLKTGVGTFSVNVIESVILHSKSQYSLTLPDLDAVNFPSEGGAAKYKSNGTLSWAHRGWTAGWTMRYFGSYKVRGAPGGPSSQQFSNGGVFGTTVATQGSTVIPAQQYHDFFVGYAFNRRSDDDKSPQSLPTKVVSNLTLQVGVRNAFNKLPPLDVQYPYYTSPYGDLRLSSYWVSVTKAF